MNIVHLSCSVVGVGPVNIPDPTRKRLVTASYGHYGQRAARIGPDSICQIRFPASVSVPFFFFKEGMDHTVQNQPGSDVDGLVIVWPNASGLEASRCAGITWPGFWQDATSPLPVSHFQTRFRSSTDVPDNIVQNQPGSDIVLADCVRFWPNGSGPEAIRCARIIRPASGQCFPADPDRMQIGSGMFTRGVFRSGKECLNQEVVRSTTCFSNSVFNRLKCGVW